MFPKDPISVLLVFGGRVSHRSCFSGIVIRKVEVAVDMSGVNGAGYDRSL